MFKAKVVSIESATMFTDKEKRVVLRIEGADSLFNQLRIPERMLGLAMGLALDDELDVDIRPEFGLAQAQMEAAGQLHMQDELGLSTTPTAKAAAPRGTRHES